MDGLAVDEFDTQNRRLNKDSEAGSKCSKIPATEVDLNLPWLWGQR